MRFPSSTMREIAGLLLPMASKSGRFVGAPRKCMCRCLRCYVPSLTDWLHGNRIDGRLPCLLSRSHTRTRYRLPRLYSWVVQGLSCAPSPDPRQPMQRLQAARSRSRTNTFVLDHQQAHQADKRGIWIAPTTPGCCGCREARIAHGRLRQQPGGVGRIPWAICQMPLPTFPDRHRHPTGLVQPLS